MCGALFLQFPILNMGTGQTVIILQMANGQQPANGVFVLIKSLDFNTEYGRSCKEIIALSSKHLIIDGIAW